MIDYGLGVSTFATYELKKSTTTTSVNRMAGYNRVGGSAAKLRRSAPLTPPYVRFTYTAVHELNLICW
jgi:hypothetical protein